MDHFTKPLRFLPLLLVQACGSIDSLPSSEEASLKMTGLEQKFDLFDLNGDGFLSRKELADGLRSIGTVENVTAENVDKVLSFYDADKDGRISLREAQRGNAAGPDGLLEMLGES